MTNENIVIAQIGLVIIFILYYNTVFQLVDTILENPRFSKWKRIPLSIISVFICLAVTENKRSSSALGYIALGLLFVINFAICYKDSFVRNLFCASACLMHVMAIRSICVSIFAIAVDQSIFETVNDTYYLSVTMAITLLLLCVVIKLVILCIPGKNIRIINQHAEQLWFMVIWISVFNLYLLINSKIYSEPSNHPSLEANQIVAPLAILIGLYVVLFFAIKTTLLLGYKEKSEMLQVAMNKEKQYRKTVMKDIMLTYEFDFSQNKIEKGFEEYEEQLGEMIHNYSDMQAFLARKIVHSDDLEEFERYAEPWKVIKEYQKGSTEIIVDYRRLMSNKEYIWVRATTNLWQDKESGNIKGYSYIRDIDVEKKHQLDLKQKAERDMLTGLYNKGMTEKLISEEIQDAEKETQGALLVIDVDNFKSINDHFGHTYGDVVLCELAEKLSFLFHEKDIVGRIGGDEFMVYSKDIKNVETIKKEAEKVVTVFAHTYQGENGQEYSISGSVGVSIFPRDARDFMELYKSADIALYQAKNKGKNCYHIFNGEVFEGYESNRTEFDVEGRIKPNNFKENRVEYIFKILYRSTNYEKAIHAVLELLAKHFMFDRSYIVEKNIEKGEHSNTFEWCEKGMTSRQKEYEGKSLTNLATIEKNLQTKGRFILDETYLFGMFEQNALIGMIGFDGKKRERPLYDREVEELALICNILGTFIVNLRTKENAQQTQAAMATVLNNLDSCTYVIRQDTFEILFINQQGIRLAGSETEGKFCYQILRGMEEKCPDCPIRKMENNKETKVVMEVYNKKYKMWTETTASYIPWSDGEMAYMVNNIDITKYKESLNF